MKKKNHLIIILMLVIILVLNILAYLLFGKDKMFTIAFNVDGGIAISNIEVKVGETVYFQEIPSKYVWVA